MAKIIPAVLEKTEEDFIRKIALLPAEAKYIHIDVLEDDIWAPIEREFEAHLMVADPLAIMDRWVKRGAKRIIVHKLTSEILEHKREVEIGLGVEMQVPIEEVLPLSRDACFVHLMSIDKIGAQGNPLDERIFDRIKELKKIYPTTFISVDGGINAENFQRLIDAGADRLVVGSHFNEVWTSQMKRS